MYAAFGLGLSVSIYVAYRLLTENIHAQIKGVHILYYSMPNAIMLHYASLAYFAVTVIPSFFSTVNRIRMFGASMAFSYVITKLFFDV